MSAPTRVFPSVGYGAGLTLPDGGAEDTDAAMAAANGMLKGTVNQWNDEKGFGFINPASDEGEQKDIFVHVSAFGGRGVLKPGEMVYYKPPERNPRNDKLMSAKVIGPGVVLGGPGAIMRQNFMEKAGVAKPKPGPTAPAPAAPAPQVPGVDVPPEYKALTIDQIRTRLTALYYKHRPSQAAHVDSLLKRFPGKEAEVLVKCEQKFAKGVPKQTPSERAAVPAAEPVGAAMWARQERAHVDSIRPKVDKGKWAQENERLQQVAMAAEAARLREAHLSAPITPASSGWAVKAQTLEGMMMTPGAAQAAALGPFTADGRVAGVPLVGTAGGGTGGGETSTSRAAGRAPPPDPPPKRQKENPFDDAGGVT